MCVCVLIMVCAADVIGSVSNTRHQMLHSSCCFYNLLEDLFMTSNWLYFLRKLSVQL